MMFGPRDRRAARAFLNVGDESLAIVGRDATTAIANQIESELDRRDMTRLASLSAFGNPLEFSREYQLKMDGRRFDATMYSHMVDPMSNNGLHMVFMAGAQTGKSTILLTRIAHFGVLRLGARIACYFPTDAMAMDMSKNKFRPMLNSCVKFRPYIGMDVDGVDGESSVSNVSFGASKFTFRSIGGRDSTEGITLGAVAFDEVRRMRPGDIQRALERISSTTVDTVGYDPMVIQASTALMPDSDIHKAFQGGTQHYFHTACKCRNRSEWGDGVILARAFPECIVDLETASLETRRSAEHACAMAGVPFCAASEEDRARYGDGMLRCPYCGMWIVDPRNGWWEAMQPDRYVQSYQFPQMLSPTFNGPKLAKKVWRPDRAADVQENFNSVAGMPYLSLDAVPVQQAHLDACVRTDLVWPATKDRAFIRRWVRQTSMGIDHMKGYNVVVVKQKAPNSKHRTVHLAVPHGENPWEECARMMQEYDVSACLLEEGPNLNEAKRFANAFPGRVFIVRYANNHKDKMVRWPSAPSDQKGTETVERGTVIINRSRALDWSLNRWATRENECPDPTGLIVRLKRRGGKVIFTPGLRDGEWESAPICRDAYWAHLQASAFEKVYATERAKDEDDFHREFAPLHGIDPHFTFADMFASVALDRVGVSLAEDYTDPWHQD